MGKYKQLNYIDVIKIETLLEEGISIPEIAIRLNRDKTTIYRCIKNNINENNEFKADDAWKKIEERQYRPKKYHRLLSDEALRAFIIEKIKTYWSPEQIAGRWKASTGKPISHETIYQYLREYEPEMIRVYIRRKGKKYRSKAAKAKAKQQYWGNKRSISDRPLIVGERKELGHWEGDTITDGSHSGGVVTNVEIKSGLLVASKIDTHRAYETYDVTVKDFDNVPDEACISITYDNGSEFSYHESIEDGTNMTVYFAHPYSPWERGCNENLNGLLRQFIPKGTDMSTVTEKDLQHYVQLLNDRPRKRHGFKTPNEIFNEELEKKLKLSKMQS